MKSSEKILVLLLLLFLQVGCAMSKSVKISSPAGTLTAEFLLEEGRPFYKLYLGQETILERSPLGLTCSRGDFTENLKLADLSAPETVSDDYTMPHGKQSRIQYRANRRVVSLQNPQGQILQIEFQVSNDGLAFRYRLIGEGQTTAIEREATGFAFASGTVSWLHPMHDSKTGWEKTYPSYESHYEIEKPVGLPSPYSAGWAFPALFRVGQIGWALLSESGVDERYCGTRLAQDSAGGVYHIAFPQANEHRGPQDPIAPSGKLPLVLPWRLIIAGRGLDVIVQSTLATDVAAPSKIADLSFIKPGRASWSWLRYDSAGTDLPILQEYLQMAADLGWEYMLVDCDWDRRLGYEKIAALSKEAHSKGVDLLLWYNSNGDWNNAPMTPKNRVHLPQVRREEFRRIAEMGIRGIKVDFFGGDKQATMQLYMDILRDAADFNLLVNFHGATLPRGWQRTWPNLVTTEAVMGMEFCTFDQANADRQAQHCCVLPFTRNVAASMDFTPLVMDRKIRGVRRKTTAVFELSLPIIFESAVQHFGLAPFEAAALPDFAVDYLKRVPTAWDQTRFVAGLPGKDAVLARRKGNDWYVAGINGENRSKTMLLDLSFLPKGRPGILIYDGADDSIQTKIIHSPSAAALEAQLAPSGGFVLQILQP